jgi:hypothetical protein
MFKLARLLEHTLDQMSAGVLSCDGLHTRLMGLPGHIY